MHDCVSCLQFTFISISGVVVTSKKTRKSGSLTKKAMREPSASSSGGPIKSNHHQGYQSQPATQSTTQLTYGGRGGPLGPPAAVPNPNQLTAQQLNDMAMRQQHQIEAQQQMLVAKEQRLKYLRQQDFKQNQMAAEYDRLRRLREKVKSLATKLIHMLCTSFGDFFLHPLSNFICPLSSFLKRFVFFPLL